ncbi:hypothetical protein ACIP5U_33965 [Streptomyces sp. NPDC088788]|uniref:hypothetical protein n=1 Tax=Streptomyces sp. NPDC088788 TaxID=3365898 RepID=UPI00382DE98E
MGIGVWDNAMVAVVAVLAPFLAGAASAIFLLVGYVLKMLNPEPALAQSMLNAGWLFAGVTAAALVTAAAGLLVTALRNGAPPGSESDDECGEVARAKEAWRDALLQRGILPFLSTALSEESAEVTQGPGTTPRMPRLGY